MAAYEKQFAGEAGLPRGPPPWHATSGRRLEVTLGRRPRLPLMLLAPSDFFTELRKALKRELPAPMRNFHSIRGRGRLMKVHFGEPSFHYEAWHHTGAGRLEVGLHFEASAVENQAAFDFFRSRMVEVKANLPRAELEPWDRGWSRLYETMPAARLDDEVVRSAVNCMTEYIVTLQPLLDQYLRSRDENS